MKRTLLATLALLFAAAPAPAQTQPPRISEQDISDAYIYLLGRLVITRMLSVAAVQAGGLGMVAVGLTRMVAARVMSEPEHQHSLGLTLWIVGLIGVFAIGYPGYFVFDAIWPSFYYSPVAAGKNAWLLWQAAFIAIYFVGFILAFNDVRHALSQIPATR